MSKNIKENKNNNNNHTGILRPVGNRRSEDELENLKILNNKTAFTLDKQENFIGTEKQLEVMQNMERAYISGAPLVSDEEWDLLKTKHNYKETLTSVSPSGRNWVKFFSPLPSLDKAGNMEELEMFLNKFKENQDFITEVKLDGLTSNLRYKLLKDKDIYSLESISSRGNGNYGLELNPYALSGVIVNFPYEIDADLINNFLRLSPTFNNGERKLLPEYFEIRGEAVIPKNKHSFEKYGKDAVWRNIASGMFNRKVPFNLDGVIQYITNGEYNLDYFCHKDDKDYHSSFYEGVYKQSLKPEFRGRKCLTPDLYNNCKLIWSLFEGNEEKYPEYVPFKRGDELIVKSNGFIELRHNDGTSIEYRSDYEELDIIMYSLSYDNSNIDLMDYCSNIHSGFRFDSDYFKGLKDGEFEKDWSTSISQLHRMGFKTISDVELQEDLRKELKEKFNAKKTFRILENNKIDDVTQEIKNIVNEFYGVDGKTNKRDKNLPRLRNMYEYACDGVVIKPIGSNKQTQNVNLRNSKNNPNKILQPKYPEDQIAVKLLSEIVRVKLAKIERNETELGNITCSGILDKEYRTESGALVSRINLHNPEWLENNSWIKEGKEYDMILSMDIIPVLLNPEL